MSSNQTITREAEAPFFAQEITGLARALVGCSIFVDGVGGRIVETEAYEPADPASHSFRGLTARNQPMYGPPGRAYVYRIYGMHWCLNLVGGLQPGAAVLIRALEPTAGVDVMSARRGSDNPLRLCAGPGRLCQALGVTAAHNGMSLTMEPFSFLPAPPVGEVVAGPRIGIRKAIDKPWRFGLLGSKFLSRPFPPVSCTDGSGALRSQDHPA